MMTLTSEQLMQLYSTMWHIRRFEEAAGEYYRAGKVKGGIHASIGQEAVAAGVCYALRPDDLIVSTHRGHGHHIAKGADPNRLMAELLGKDGGYNRGRGGSMHVAAFDVGSLGAFPVVGSGIPVAVGAALSLQMQNTEGVVAVFFGDGASTQGTLHEAINMAALWRLPLVFVYENNQFAVSTRHTDDVAFQDKVAWAASYGVQAWSVDGQQVDAVYTATAQAVDLARGGAGPTLLEAITYRFEGHYFGEPEVYRSRDEVREQRTRRDPLVLLAARLESQGVDPTALEAIEQDACAVIEAAKAFAEASPDPDPDTYADYVYT